MFWGFILIILSFTQLYHAAQIKEFDECDKSPAGIHICRKQQECESAESVIKEGKSLKLCRENGGVTIVCCPPSKTSIDSNTSKKIKSMNNNLSSVENDNSTSAYIVEQMCQKYAEEQYDVIRKQSIIDHVNPDFVSKESRCHNSNILDIQPDEAALKEFPHMALVGFGTDLEHVQWLCVGSLISERYVLTAAHCSNGGRAVGSANWVRLGELDYSTKLDGSQDVDYEIVQRINHPEYKPPSVYNDIALLKLNKIVTFNAFVRPICLNTVKVITQKEATAAGWGATRTGSLKISEKLLKIKESLVSFENCSQIYGVKKLTLTRGIETDKMLCAGVAAGEKDTCNGFGGGPLMVKVEGEPCLYRQIGIISGGSAVCGIGHPGVHTRVSNYIPWIQQIVWP